MLMTPISCKLLRGSAVGYEYKTDTDTSNILIDATTKDVYLVGKINHETFNIPGYSPLHVKIDIKFQPAPSNFILRNVVGTPPDATVSLTSAIPHGGKQQVMISVALAIEELTASENNIELLVPHTITNQLHIALDTGTYSDVSFINGEIPSKSL